MIGGSEQPVVGPVAVASKTYVVRRGFLEDVAGSQLFLSASARST